MKHYQYIFTGCGLSALMTVYEMIQSGKFKDKQILLLDENPKKTNDRTWCFWETKDSFESIVSLKWQKAWFKNHHFERILDLHPYQYKRIKGLDFYNLVFEEIAKNQNIHFAIQKVQEVKDFGSYCAIKTESESYTCDQVFQSIFKPEEVKKQSTYPFLHQHFIGWFVKSEEKVFTSDCATFMDFSVAQNGNTRFMYVLPSSETEALVEYTLFSKDLLPKEEYEIEIKNYLRNLGCTNFEIVEKEQGNIPMTCYPFWKQNSKNIVHIGSAGGWTKASTGFTFKNTTKKAKALVRFLEKDFSTALDGTNTKTDLRKFHKTNKFWLYDLLLLDILDKQNELGSTIFSSMFEKGNATVIFKFLDEETSFWEDLQVIWKCPKGLFIKALLRRIF